MLHCPENMATLLKLVGETLGVGVAWHHQGRFHFRLPGPGRTIALSSESAGRLRIDACQMTEVRDTRWVLADDRARLAAVITEMAGTPALA
jgi:hypothetical protein